MFEIFKKQKQEFKYFDLSSREQKKIIKRCIREANEEQLNLVKKFEERLRVEKLNNH